MKKQPVLAIVDDEPEIRSLVRIVAESMGWRVEEMESGAELREALDDGLVPTLVITDILMPNEDGIELAQCLSESNAVCRLQILTGGPALYADAIRAILSDSTIELLEPLQKPVPVSELRRTLRSVAPDHDS